MTGRCHNIATLLVLHLHLSVILARGALLQRPKRCKRGMGAGAVKHRAHKLRGHIGHNNDTNNKDQCVCKSNRIYILAVKPSLPNC